jgi:hypothetical protein
MPRKKYLVETDKGKFEVEVEEPGPAVNTHAKGGDTIMGEDPNDPSVFSRITGALGHAAQPESTGDFLSLIVPSGIGEAVSGMRDFGRIIKQAGQESPTWKGIPGQAMKILRERPKNLQDFQAEGFNKLPLAEQMKNLPDVPAPPRMRMGEPLPTIKVPTVQGEVVGARPPRPPIVDAEVVDVPHQGLPPASSRQMPPSQMLDDLPADVPDMTLEERMGLGKPEETGEMPGTPDEPERVVNDTPDEPSPDAGQVQDPHAIPDPNTILGDMDPVTEAYQAGVLPLGKPRVLSWKSGQGPTDELIGQIRDQEGSKAAARRLAIPQKQVTERAPRMAPRALPPEAQSRIAAKLEGMTPEEKLVYLESAPNGLTEAFIKSLIGNR